VIGLSCIPVLPSADTSQIRTPIPGGESIDGVFQISWPIWRHPMTLSAVRALLGTQYLGRGIDRNSIGVVAVMRATRVGLGKYVAFTRAVELQV
jgi:hypothetical protein